MSSARSGTRVITDRAGIATDADKIRATGIHQPAAVAELANTDDGRATLARRIKSDGLK